jgi:FKBP-type peptidyl-prolyl cis-trans isomerase SlpA
MSQNNQAITSQSHVTLHYRIAVLDSAGNEVSNFLNTFKGNPATVAIGQAQLAPFMEDKLMGLSEGAHEHFNLSADEAFGDYNSELRQLVSRQLLLEGNPQVDTFGEGDFVEFAMPNGYRMTGQFMGWNDDKTGAVVDFNHPLAGKPLRLELQVIGVL